jgi:hypothetical protein
MTNEGVKGWSLVPLGALSILHSRLRIIVIGGPCSSFGRSAVYDMPPLMLCSSIVAIITFFQPLLYQVATAGVAFHLEQVRGFRATSEASRSRQGRANTPTSVGKPDL